MESGKRQFQHTWAKRTASTAAQVDAASVGARLSVSGVPWLWEAFSWDEGLQALPWNRLRVPGLPGHWKVLGVLDVRALRRRWSVLRLIATLPPAPGRR